MTPGGCSSTLGFEEDAASLHRKAAYAINIPHTGAECSIAEGGRAGKGKTLILDLPEDF